MVKARLERGMPNYSGSKRLLGGRRWWRGGDIERPAGGGGQTGGAGGNGEACASGVDRTAGEVRDARRRSLAEAPGTSERTGAIQGERDDGCAIAGDGGVRRGLDGNGRLSGKRGAGHASPGGGGERSFAAMA